MNNEAAGAGRARQPAGQIVELLKRHRDSARKASFNERVIGRAASLFGTIGSVYFHLIVFGAGALVATKVIRVPGVALDAGTLALFASVETIFITTFVLISQRRMQELSEMRANLTLHISLLEERETTRLIHLVTLLARERGIALHDDEELRELMREVKPEELLREIDNANDGGE